ncbi:MAG TPA: hypothetical protein VJV78_21530 [Polyangiales bacterium]|nr:hypothetical protein [Polyangiales bacterium]
MSVTSATPAHAHWHMPAQTLDVLRQRYRAASLALSMNTTWSQTASRSESTCELTSMLQHGDA